MLARSNRIQTGCFLRRRRFFGMFFRYPTRKIQNQKFPNHLIENFPANRLLSRHSLDKRESSNQYFLKFFDRFVKNFPDNGLTPAWPKPKKAL